MAPEKLNPKELLRLSLARERVHTAYLISGAGDAPRSTAEWAARALVCTESDTDHRPCDDCPACRKSRASDEAVKLDATGKSGPFYRHVGDHPDLLWVERAADKTRVSIGQVRALQVALRRASSEGGWRVGVVADAEWLNVEAQNALLRLLEEPPDRAAMFLVSRSASSVLSTIRSRCVRIAYPSEERVELRSDDSGEEVSAVVDRLDEIDRLDLPQLLDWAEEYRGARAVAAAQVDQLLATGTAWLHERTRRLVEQEPQRDIRPLLDAFTELTHCRRDLTQRNANPQMVAERGLFAVRGAVSR